MDERNVHLEMRNLKRKERQRIRLEHKKTENHKKQRPATLKRLKRGDDNELERNTKLEKVVDSEQLRLAAETRRRKKSKTGECCGYQTAQFGHGDGQRKKIKTGEDGSYRTAHVSPDQRCGQCGCGFDLKPILEKLATMLIIQT